ncbi:MAG: hypothetical protein JEZ07_20255 [Phycisphaerae bacterium]|nr:hypothetical protein [Phycisphaerae bacterium]
MYAGLIVTLWSNIEGYLKGLVRVSEQIDSTNLKKQPWKIDELKKYYNDKRVIKLDKLESFNFVDAVRIFNNSFKHSEGFIRSDKPDNVKAIELLEQLQAHQQHEEGIRINYEKLPIEELFAASCRFFGVLERLIAGKLGINHGK